MPVETHPTVQRLQETFYFFRSNLNAIALVVLVINAPLFALQLWFEHFVLTPTSPPTLAYFPIVVAVLVGPLSSAAVIFLIARLVANKPWRLSELLLEAVRVWPPLLVTTALVAVIVFLGLIALILPGIYLMLRLVFAEFAVVLEGQVPMRAIERSFALTKAHIWEIFQPLSMLFFGYVALQWLVNVVVTAVAPGQALISAAVALVFSVLSAAFTVLLYRLYEITRGPQEQSRQ